MVERSENPHSTIRPRYIESGRGANEDGYLKPVQSGDV
jgi:hypothetical protein